MLCSLKEKPKKLFLVVIKDNVLSKIMKQMNRHASEN